MKTTTFSALTISLVLALLPGTSGQDEPWRNPQHDPRRYLTADGYYHNRYHAVLSMAAYGDYNATCPVQTFTEEAKLRNFPNSERPPWTILEEWDTPSGCSGFSAIVPEMNKVLLVFKGNYEMEKNLPTETVPWTYLGINGTCESCTVNAYAAQGWMEAKAATNNFAVTLAAYSGAGLVFSITGHGLGGMHSQIASVDLNYQNIAYYSHAYGSPRVFNVDGASWYNWRFNGEAGERGIAENDLTSEIIPASENYTHAGTPFYYWGYNGSTHGANMRVCWLDEAGPDNEACLPSPANSGSNLTSDQSHYFYFTNVLDCGLSVYPNRSIIDNFLATNATSDFPAQQSVLPSTSALPTESAFPSASASASADLTGENIAPANLGEKSSGASRTLLDSLLVGVLGFGAWLLL